jgi:hypothetical protein
MNPPGTFSGERIRELISEVAELLDEGQPRATVVIVGGSLLAWRGLRLATEDVDSSIRLEAEVKAAVRVVAKRHGLAVDWLNDHAAPWHPQTLSPEDCDVLIDHPRLRILGAPLASVFVMKLNRSQPQDMTDMIVLWPHVADEFPSARAVVDAYSAAFPMEEPDEFLSAQVVDVARRAGMTLPLD